MSEVYSSGIWKVKDGEDQESVDAWTDFAKGLSTMRGPGSPG